MQNNVNKQQYLEITQSLNIKQKNSNYYKYDIKIMTKKKLKRIRWFPMRYGNNKIKKFYIG